MLRDPFLTEHEVAEVLGCSPACLRKWRSQQTGPDYFKLGKLIRYRESALEAFVSASKRGRQTESQSSYGSQV